MLEKLSKSEKNLMLCILAIKVLDHKAFVIGMETDVIYLHAG